MALSQKALSTKRCIKTPASEHKGAPSHRQKAPSAKRCIKTCPHPSRRCRGQPCVRKHRAPKGALRPGALSTRSSCDCPVRKHQAPKGALRRLLAGVVHVDLHRRQKAPSAKRCITTCSGHLLPSVRAPVRKHRAPKGALRQYEWDRHIRHTQWVRKHQAPKGALRLEIADIWGRVFDALESTEHQKVH